MSVFPSALRDEQQMLIDAVWKIFHRLGVWPIWEYVEHELDVHDLDATDVLASMPTVGVPTYGLIRPTFTGARTPQEDQPVALTIAGLSYVPAAAGLIETFFSLLELMHEARRTTEFSPTSLTQVVVTDTMLAEYLGTTTQSIAPLARIIDNEPPTWFHANSALGPNWARLVRREIQHFADVRAVEDYVARIAAYLAPPEPSPAPRYVSPFELNAALDYLNVVWMLRFGQQRPLLRYFSAERAAKIALEAETQDEFFARLTALGEILKNVDVPGTPGIGGHPLTRLPAYLKANLADASEERIDQAVAVLDAIRLLRDSGQHVNAQVNSADRLPLLGLTFPITDFAGAWNTVSTKAIEAVDALRDELSIQSVPEDGPEPA